MKNIAKIKISYLIPIFIVPVLLTLQRLNMFPYYFAWDSSVLYMTDTLLVNGGLMPGHLFHPDIGALWFEKFFIFPIVKSLGFVSISTMQEFQSSFNPALNAADIVSFLLTLRTCYLYLASTMFYIAFLKLFEEILENFSPILKTLTLLALALMSYWYVGHNVVMVRYEYMGVLWGSLSFLMMVYAVQTKSKWYIVFMGFFAGLAFISKIILLPSLIFYVLLYFALTYDENEFVVSSKERKNTLIMSLILAIMVFLGVVSMVILKQTDSFKPSIFLGVFKSYKESLLITGFPFIAFVLSLVVLSLLAMRTRGFDKAVYYLSRLTLYSVFLFLPLFIQIFQSNGLNIFTNGYIFSYAFGQILMSLGSGYNSTTDRVTTNITVVMLILLALVLAVTVGMLVYSFKKNNKYYQTAFLLSAFCFVLVLNNILLRGGNEVELGMYTTFIALILIVLSVFSIWHKRSVIVVAALLSILYTSVSLTKQIQQNNLSPIIFTSYYFSIKEWYEFAYGAGDTALYPETLKKVYYTQNNWEKALYWSKDIGKTKILLRSLGNNPNQLQDSAIAFIGGILPHYKEELTNVSSEIENALVLATPNAGLVRVRSDYHFYIVSEERIENDENTLLTELKFNGYYVYMIRSSEKQIWSGEYDISLNKKIKYLIINDYWAKSL